MNDQFKTKSNIHIFPIIIDLFLCFTVCWIDLGFKKGPYIN